MLAGAALVLLWPMARSFRPDTKPAGYAAARIGAALTLIEAMLMASDGASLVIAMQEP